MSKVAMVTGAGRGIGAATAVLLAKQGYNLALCYRADEASISTVRTEVEALGRKTIVLKLDVSQEHEVEAAFEEFDETFSRLDVSGGR